MASGEKAVVIAPARRREEVLAAWLVHREAAAQAVATASPEAPHVRMISLAELAAAVPPSPESAALESVVG